MRCWPPWHVRSLPSHGEQGILYCPRRCWILQLPRPRCSISRGRSAPLRVCKWWRRLQAPRCWWASVAMPSLSPFGRRVSASCVGFSGHSTWPPLPRYGPRLDTTVRPPCVILRGPSDSSDLLQRRRASTSANQTKRRTDWTLRPATDSCLLDRTPGASRCLLLHTICGVRPCHPRRGDFGGTVRCAFLAVWTSTRNVKHPKANFLALVLDMSRFAVCVSLFFLSAPVF